MTKINWKVRFKNKAFLVTFITMIIAFMYQILAIFEVVPKISQDDFVSAVMIVINLLATLGIVTDPTTAGVTDSDQALTYTAPKKDGE